MRKILALFVVSILHSPWVRGAAHPLSTEEILRLTRTEANGELPVCATGVVTLVANWRSHSEVKK